MSWFLWLYVIPAIVAYAMIVLGVINDSDANGDIKINKSILFLCMFTPLIPVINILFLTVGVWIEFEYQKAVKEQKKWRNK